VTQNVLVDQTPPTITIAPVVGNGIVNLSTAHAGFVISGGAIGADGQTVTVAILDSSGRIVDSYTTTAAGGAWSVNVKSTDAIALRDGTYTVTASATDAAGNPASVTQNVLVDQTPPTITITAITGDNSINLAEAQAGFAIGGGVIGADGQTVTVAILDGSGRIVDSYTTVAAGGAWSVNVRSSDATALRDGTYTERHPEPDGRRDRADDHDRGHHRRQHNQSCRGAGRLCDRRRRDRRGRTDRHGCDPRWQRQDRRQLHHHGGGRRLVGERQVC
jgi:hypothetical protein